MREKFVFKNQHDFMNKLEELVKSGISYKKLELFTPHPVHGMEEVLKMPKTPLRFFTLIGALSGLIFGFWFTSWTSMNWPLITGGKPIVSIPAFIIIAFELTVLFGGVISFLGFLFLARLPSVKHIIEPEEIGNQFIIEISE